MGKFNNVPVKIIVHCADTPNGRVFTQHDVDSWHVERGFKRTFAMRNKQNPDLTAIGYHAVIGVGGEIWTGRYDLEIGSHCVGENQSSLGVCLLGKNKFTQAQFDALQRYIAEKQVEHGIDHDEVHGHFEYDSAKQQGKTCPNFDVNFWWLTGCVPNPAITYGAE